MFKVKEGLLIGSKAITGTGPTEVLTAADVGTMAYQNVDSFSISTLTASAIRIDDSDSGYYLNIQSTSTNTQDRSLVFDVNDGTRTVSLSGNLTTSHNFTTTTGAVTIAANAAGSSVTLPASGILVGQSDANTVSNAMIRQSGALSIVGRSANSTGNVADITATAATGAVLRESGSAIGWGTIATAGIADTAVTYAKIQNVSATSRVLGRITAGAGSTEELTADNVVTIVNGATTQIANARVVYSTLTIGNGLSGSSYNTSSAVTIAVSAGQNATSAAYYPVFATTQGTSVVLGTNSTFSYNPGTGLLAVAADIVGQSATANVFNSTSTTVNAFGAATSITIGALNNGFTTIRNALTVSDILTCSKAVRETRIAMGANDVATNTGSYFTKTISGVTTLTFSGAPGAGTATAFVLELTNPGANVTWPVAVKWPNGAVPTLSTTGVDALAFYTHDGGTTWRGNLLARYVN